jgi:hypothetical protein
MGTKLFLLMLSIIIISCEKDQISKKRIPDKYFNVKLTEKQPMDSLNYNHFVWDYIEVKNLGEWKINYTSNRKYHYFNNTLYEIQFPSVRFNLKNKFGTLHCLIGKGVIDEDQFSKFSDKCFYIFWLNRSIEDKLHHFYKEWGIGHWTDTIYTNIDEKMIKDIYPEFNGKVVNGNITEIIIYQDFDISSWWFYQDIELVGFNRLKDNYKTLKDSIPQRIFEKRKK